MVNHKWSYAAGFLLTGGCVGIGLLSNLLLYGDPLAVAESISSLVDGITILLTTLFIAISGGHYIGGSFNKDSSARWFALGANSVLWLVLLAFIGFRFRQGGAIIGPALYTVILICVGGGIFALHKSGHVEDGSELGEYIGILSSQGTGVVVTMSFIVRTAPKPVYVGILVTVLSVTGLLLWKANEEEINTASDSVKRVLDDLSTSDESE